MGIHVHVRRISFGSRGFFIMDPVWIAKGVDRMSKYSIVIPCYQSSKTIAHVVSQTVEELHKLGINDFEFVLVNDCSPDGGATIRELDRLADEFDYIRVVDLGKNFGQNNATMAGLNYADGDFFISMDDDGQTDPSQLKYLIDKLEEGYDLVYGHYVVKKENAFRRLGSALNHWTVKVLLNKPDWLRTSSFWIARKYVRDYAVRFTYPNVHLQGVLLRVTSNIATVPVRHRARETGRSGYTFKKLVQLYSNIFSFSMVPLNLVTNAGLIIAGLSFLMGIIMLIRKLLHPEMLLGWLSLFVGICFLTGLNLVAIGIVGMYIGRLYRGESDTPQYVVKSVRQKKKPDGGPDDHAAIKD